MVIDPTVLGMRSPAIFSVVLHVRHILLPFVSP